MTLLVLLETGGAAKPEKNFGLVGCTQLLSGFLTFFTDESANLSGQNLICFDFILRLIKISFVVVPIWFVWNFSRFALVSLISQF